MVARKNCLAFKVVPSTHVRDTLLVHSVLKVPLRTRSSFLTPEHYLSILCMSDRLTRVRSSLILRTLILMKSQAGIKVYNKSLF